MFHKTEGIVLHGLKYGDSARIVTVYTEAFGRCSFILQGIHSKKSSNKANLLQPLFLLDMEIDHRQGRELQRAREIRTNHPYNTVPYDIVKASQAIFLAELLFKVLKEEEARPELFQFLAHSFRIFDLIQHGVANFHIAFLIQLTRYMGFEPTDNFSEEKPILDMASGLFVASRPPHPYFMEQIESRIFAELIASPYEEIGNIALNSTLRYQILVKIIDYFSLHLGIHLHIKSLEVLRELFT
ncbi:MAG: DNA repair protein RecO [Prolixibacteraceae bacterium]|jgi:DNA repair protein RecO (recombination protein O)|nr:DNA repair protein RecO [Prolixibacteraceae bacterium]